MLGPDEAPESVREELLMDSGLYEKVISDEVCWEGTIFSTHLLEVELPDGSRGSREIVRHHGGAGVVAVRDGKICLVKQWRVVLGGVTLEIPAGKLDEGESAEKCAARELLEETGLVASSLAPLSSVFGSCGFTDETTRVFYAEGLEQGSSDPDDGEFVNVCWLPVEDVVQAILCGAIRDGKTVSGVLAARTRGLL